MKSSKFLLAVGLRLSDTLIFGTYYANLHRKGERARDHGVMELLAARTLWGWSNLLLGPGLSPMLALISHRSL